MRKNHHPNWVLRLLPLLFLGTSALPLVCQADPAAAANETSLRLTVELRDGSRVVGQTVEDTVRVHSDALGDLTLSWVGIRSLEYTTDTGAAKLTTTNGDSFVVQLTADTLPVQTGFGKIELPAKLIRNLKVAPPSKRDLAPSPAAGESGWRLTLELRDNSRIIGQALDNALKFHSATMGDLNLTWAGIRSIEYASTNSDVARLTATNGDVYEAQFVTTVVPLETSMGRTEMPVNMIRSIKVSALGRTGQMPSGLVALWSAEGNADDSVGGRHGQLENQAGYAPGIRGQAFAFHNLGDGVVAPATDLPIGTSDRTIDCWIYVESFNPAADTFVAGYGVSAEGQGYSFGLQKQDHRLILSQWGEGVSGPVLESGRWYNLAVTSAGTISKLYVDGVNVATGAMKFNTPAGTQFHIGQVQAPYTLRQLIGRIDEVAVYDRALSDDEIMGIYEAADTKKLTAQ